MRRLGRHMVCGIGIIGSFSDLFSSRYGDQPLPSSSTQPNSWLSLLKCFKGKSVMHIMTHSPHLNPKSTSTDIRDDDYCAADTHTNDIDGAPQTWLYFYHHSFHTTPCVSSQPRTWIPSRSISHARNNGATARVYRLSFG